MIGATTKKAIIQVNLEDKASAGLKKLQSNTETTSEKMRMGFSKIAIAVTAVTTAVVGTTAALMSMATRAGKIEGLALGFERNFGDMEKALQSFRKASAGMVSDFDLMQTANRAALLGVTNDVDKLSGLMVTARLRGREMGMDMTQAFDDIVRGIGRMSPLILDNLGIIIPDAIKESMESMTELEQRQILLNYAIEDGAKLAAEYGSVNLTASEKVEILKAKVVNFKDEALAKLATPLGNIIDQFGKWFDKLVVVAEKIGKTTTDEVSAMKDALTNPDYGLVKGVGDMDTAWGNLMESFTGENKNAVETMIQMFVGWTYILTEVTNAMEKLFNWLSKVKDKWDKYQISSMEKYKENNPEGGWRDTYFGKNATGGVTSGGMTLVGERGAELVSLPRGSHVYNSEDTKQMAGNGGITINVNAPVTGVDNLKAAILEAVNEATERQNRLANYNLL
jgi:hypothetical protein